MKTEIIKAFNNYKNIVFTSDTDLSFWKSFLETSINEYIIKNPNQIALYQAGFHVYDCSFNSNYGRLKRHNEIRSIETINIEKYKNDFFYWISNLTVLKTYNALENFILQAIHIKYFNGNKYQIGSKKAIEQTNIDIKFYLKENGLNVDTKNNRHILQFLKNQSEEIASFLGTPIRIDLKTNWENFFELISILRNIIAHQGTIVSLDTHNEIKSRAKDIFQRHFTIREDEDGYKTLQPNNEQYSNFLSLFNDFSVNLVKFMFDENDLKFLEMN